MGAALAAFVGGEDDERKLKQSALDYDIDYERVARGEFGDVDPDDPVRALPVDSVTAGVGLRVTWQNSRSTTFSVGGTNLQVSYVGGDGNDVTLTVVTGAAVATTTAVTGAPNPSVFGQSVTLTATVTGSSPTGTGQFRDGATNLGAPVALAGGQAQLVTSALAVGAHSITAVYGGDSGNQGSTSPVFTQTVNAAATTTAIVSALPGTLAPGQSVTVNVIVAAVAPGAGTPTGTVDVTDGGSPLCTVTLSGGSGACAAALNTLGTHPLTASYVATTSHNASSSESATSTQSRSVGIGVASEVTGGAAATVTFVGALLLATFAANRLRRR